MEIRGRGKEGEKGGEGEREGGRKGGRETERTRTAGAVGTKGASHQAENLGDSGFCHPQAVVSILRDVKENRALQGSVGLHGKGTVCFYIPYRLGWPRNVCVLSLGGWF